MLLKDRTKDLRPLGLMRRTDELLIDSTGPAVTVNPLRTIDTTPILTGTYDAVDSVGGFSVAVDGVTYVLGTDLELTASGDDWTLNLSAITPLAEGIYPVTATAIDWLGNLGTDPTNNELNIDLTPPIVTVNPLTTNDTTPQLTGTIDDTTASITVTVNGTGYAATNNGNGTWTLANNTISSSPSRFGVNICASPFIKSTRRGWRAWRHRWGPAWQCR